MSAVLTFLAGSTFRMLWGEASKFIQARQEHKHELELLKVQREIEADKFQQQQDAIRLHAELGVKTIAAQSEADLALADANGFYETIKAAQTQKTGVLAIDAWNGSIRPLCATIAVLLWVFALAEAGFSMSDWDKELVAGILGFYFASREFTKRR